MGWSGSSWLCGGKGLWAWGQRFKYVLNAAIRVIYSGTIVLCSKDIEQYLNSMNVELNW